MATKTQTEKLLEKQMKEQKRQADQALKQAKEQQCWSEAQSIVNNSRVVNGFRVMDDDTEELFTIIMGSYDGNKDGNVALDMTKLPHNIQTSLNIRCKALKLYGMILDEPLYMGLNGVFIRISNSAKNYFKRKEEAEAEAERVRNSRNPSSDEREPRELEDKQQKQHKQYDVFISHAASDKMSYVNDLYTVIRKLGIQIFYDTDSISWGDNWKDQILKGTKESEFAIIVISNNFFGREWTEIELNEFLSQQNDSGQKIVLPLLYEINVNDLKKHYPEVGEIQCISASRYTKEEIAIQLAKELIKRYKQI